MTKTKHQAQTPGSKPLVRHFRHSEAVGRQISTQNDTKIDFTSVARCPHKTVVRGDLGGCHLKGDDFLAIDLDGWRGFFLFPCPEKLARLLQSLYCHSLFKASRDVFVSSDIV